VHARRELAETRADHDIDERDDGEGDDQDQPRMGTVERDRVPQDLADRQQRLRVHLIAPPSSIA
jgi:hypothetical protein